MFLVNPFNYPTWLLNITYSTYLCFTLLISRVLKWVNRGYTEKWIHMVKMMILFEAMVTNYWIYLLFGIWFLFITLSTLNKIITIWSWNPLYILLPFAIIKNTLNIFLILLIGFIIFLLMFLIGCLKFHNFHVCNANCTSNCLSSLWNVMGV
jgi:hypothetical protein